MQKDHITVRISVDTLQEVDRLAFTRRLQRVAGRSATRSAVINDLLALALDQPNRTTTKEYPQ